MTSDQPQKYSPALTRSGRTVLWVMVALPCCIEFLLQATDAGLLGAARWRMLAYQNGAFWTGLLGNWQPNYAVQPVTMFLSYALLHAGVAHLTGNMLALIFFGRRVMNMLGAGRFLLLYAGSAIGGGAGFALLSSTQQPMVGASGALFGLAGALLCHEMRLRTRLGLPCSPVVLKIAGLAMLNLLFWFVEDGLLAWEAHLGGFLTGWALMALFRWKQKPGIPPAY